MNAREEKFVEQRKQVQAMLCGDDAMPTDWERADSTCEGFEAAPHADL